jgi:putative aldouronate transport system permease protein
LKPLQLHLMDVIQYASDPLKSVDEGMNTRMAPESVRAATILAATLPILLVYPFLQKYFVKGVLLGSVKE